MNTETEQSIVLPLIEELNTMFWLELSSNFSFDRQFVADNDVCIEDSRTRYILISASHLQRLAAHLDNENWNVVDLTRPGWHVTETAGKDLVTDVEDAMLEADVDNTIMIISL